MREVTSPPGALLLLHGLPGSCTLVWSFAAASGHPKQLSSLAENATKGSKVKDSEPETDLHMEIWAVEAIALLFTPPTGLAASLLQHCLHESRQISPQLNKRKENAYHISHPR
ncbi:hypothetical protein EK904_006061 [Melospiza melodia maxima]|nr:hypothetical protein EK904_006061 [Melospiza melodia maxima]